MLSRLKQKYNHLKMLSQQKNSPGTVPAPEKIPEAVQEFTKKLKEVFSECNDFIVREITLGEQKIKIIVAQMDNLAKKQIINDSILQPLLDTKLEEQKEYDSEHIIELLKTRVINSADLQEVKDWNQLVSSILSGDSVIYVDGSEKALSIGTKGWEERSIQEPQTETVIRGPREGFIENVGVNCALIRRKIKNPNLKMEMVTLGQQTNTDICICYIKGIVQEDLLNTVRSRISKINLDAVLESGYIEEYLEDNPLFLFPTVGNSEKPDIVAAKLLEGRVAIVCDGTPFVLTVPYLFLESLQTSEDYYSRSISATLMRILRIIAFHISLLLPAIYVALLNFHHSVLPLKLLLTVTASRDGLPFSPFTETLFMGLTFEILQEAGVRMPRPIGQAVSIVGALVIGEASVRAGLASNPIIIITSLTAISTFILPPLQRILPYYRVMFLIVANILGLLGIFLMLIAMVISMCSARSFGVPYMSPFAPFSIMDIKDTFLRMPHWFMGTRPKALTSQYKGKDKFRIKISPKENGE